VSDRAWRCWCGDEVVGSDLQDHLVNHERAAALARGDRFVWFDDESGVCARCGVGVPRAFGAGAHLCA
jgi:hypothetical protein